MTPRGKVTMMQTSRSDELKIWGDAECVLSRVYEDQRRVVRSWVQFIIHTAKRTVVSEYREQVIGYKFAQAFRWKY